MSVELRVLKYRTRNELSKSFLLGESRTRVGDDMSVKPLTVAVTISSVLISSVTNLLGGGGRYCGGSSRAT